VPTWILWDVTHEASDGAGQMHRDECQPWSFGARVVSYRGRVRKVINASRKRTRLRQRWRERLSQAGRGIRVAGQWRQWRPEKVNRKIWQRWGIAAAAQQDPHPWNSPLATKCTQKCNPSRGRKGRKKRRVWRFGQGPQDTFT
jgi:hypothetical protein